MKIPQILTPIGWFIVLSIIGLIFIGTATAWSYRKEIIEIFTYEIGQQPEPYPIAHAFESQDSTPAKAETPKRKK